jgi:hypothetical protein
MLGLVFAMTLAKEEDKAVQRSDMPKGLTLALFP